MRKLMFVAATTAMLCTTARAEIIPHPAGCPRTLFCACGASVEVFGRAIKKLFAARAWFRFQRAHAASGMVAVRPHHVFVLVSHVKGKDWLVLDYNSGGHKSRRHVRSIAGYTIVDPHSNAANYVRHDALDNNAHMPYYPIEH